jgi:hypothetical protein
MLGTLLLAANLAGSIAPVPDQTLIFYNARLAQRHQEPEDVLKLWLLHNTATSLSGSRGVSEPDFLSVVWAALGQLGLCQDGLATDERGAGLWPIALHNWLVKNLSMPDSVPDPSVFDSFDYGQQERFVSLHDVLTETELKSVAFFHGSCKLPWASMFDHVDGLPDLKDRNRVAELLRHLLQESRKTLAADKIDQRAVVEARIFDLDLFIAGRKAEEAKRLARENRLRAKSQGVAAPQEAPIALSLPETTEEGEILRASLHWTPAAWLTLNQERRLFLFDHARHLSTDPAALDRLIIAIIDALGERRSGSEVEQWIALLDASVPEARRALFWGDRGARLLALDRQSGFRERSPIALHRGVAFLEAGDLQESMRSFAFALSHAEESRESGTVLALSRRWLSYVLSQHKTDEDVIAALVAMVPRHEYNAVIEDLVWRAALTGDLLSFDVCTKRARGSSAFIRRVERLRPLAGGNLTEFGKGLRVVLDEEPSATLRFLRQLVDRLEGEEANVRKTQVPTLHLLLKLLGPVIESSAEAGHAGPAKAATDLTTRIEGILEGLAELATASKAERGARALSPATQTFVGAVRLAPADALPWPFSVGDVYEPSAISPLGLVPVEWRDAEGGLVMGWRIEE